MLGNGYRAITLGAENSDIQKEHLNLFSNLKIIVAYDYDDAGKKEQKNSKPIGRCC